MHRRRRTRVITLSDDEEQPSTSQGIRSEHGGAERTDHDYFSSNTSGEINQSNNTTDTDDDRPSSSSNNARGEDEDQRIYQQIINRSNDITIYNLVNVAVEELDSSDYEELDDEDMSDNNHGSEERHSTSTRRLATSHRRELQRFDPAQQNFESSTAGSSSSAASPSYAISSDGVGTEQANQDSDHELPTTSSAKKRKISPEKSDLPSLVPENLNESNDFAQCSICLDDWEMSGEHRLVSLKCGHLYGDSCIRRWMEENTRKFCPQCKAKVSHKDLRYIYAKRIYAVDRSEEQNLREQIKKEKFEILQLKTSMSSLQMSLTMANQRIREYEFENKRLKNLLSLGGMNNGANGNIVPGQNRADYRLSLDRNIDISRETGSRVMIFSDQNSTLLVSQHNDPQSLFPGYGVRYVDVNTFRTAQFVFASSKLLRDISLSHDQKMYAVAAIDNIVKIFDVKTPVPSTIFSCNNRPLWACSFGKKTRENLIYIGTQNGSTCVYDIRVPNFQLQEFRADGDISPVINIEQVPNSCIFPNGGLLVCTLQALWFYEYTEGLSELDTVTTCISTDGPFTSMNYNHERESLLVSARSNRNFPKSRYIIGKLDKVDATPVFTSKITMFGAKASPVMTRCAQIFIDESTLVSGYIQDEEMLALYDIRRETRIQSLPVHSLIYDMCPLYIPGNTYLAALTASKCRIYKINALS